MATTILAVDDIEANRFSLQSLLEEYLEDVDILLASSGEEALEIVYEKSVDLIILDIQMPGLDGFETAKFLKKNPKTCSIPIIFLTAAFKKEEFREKGFKIGAVDYLTKPIDNDQLINKLKLYLELFSKNKELLEKEEIMIAQSRHAAMGEMSSMIAHQWRQPLSLISTTVGNMQLELEFDEFNREEFKENCIEIASTTQRLSEIIENFANSFLIADKQTKVCINDIILGIYMMISPSLESNNIKINKELKSKRHINVYSQEIKQVVISIIKNAIEALIRTDVEYPAITIKSWDEGSNIYFEICDNAGGIKDKHIKKIYDPYFSTKEEKNGVGLGLYMSKSIIEKHHHGKVEVKNLHNGACFRVMIPS